MDRIQPAMFHVRGLQFIYLFLKACVEEYFLDHPDDEETKEQWRSFCVDFAYLRYRRDPSLFERVNNFFKAIWEKLTLFRMDHEASSDVLLTIFKELCNDPNLLDVDLGLLLGGETTDERSWIGSVHVLDMQQTFFLLVREVLAIYPWVKNFCEQKLTASMSGVFKKTISPNDPGKNFAQTITEGFKRLDAQMHAIGRIQSDSVEGIIKRIREINAGDMGRVPAGDIKFLS